MDNEKMYFVMDETSAPYNIGEEPFVRTAEDEEFDKMIINKYGLVLNESEC